MEIEEAQLKRIELEQQITVLLQEFEKQVGLDIVEISIPRPRVRGFDTQKIQDVVVKVLL